MTFLLANHGRIEQVGTPDEVYEHPATPFVLEFLGQVNRWNDTSDGVPAYVRPHEIEVLARAEPGALAARLAHGVTIGPNARLEFLVDDATPINVELTCDSYRSLDLKTGEIAWLKPQRSRRFHTGS